MSHLFSRKKVHVKQSIQDMASDTLVAIVKEKDPMKKRKLLSDLLEKKGTALGSKSDDTNHRKIAILFLAHNGISRPD